MERTHREQVTVGLVLQLAHGSQGVPQVQGSAAGSHPGSPSGRASCPERRVQRPGGRRPRRGGGRRPRGEGARPRAGGRRPRCTSRRESLVRGVGLLPLWPAEPPSTRSTASCGTQDDDGVPAHDLAQPRHAHDPLRPPRVVAGEDVEHLGPPRPLHVACPPDASARPGTRTAIGPGRSWAGVRAAGRSGRPPGGRRGSATATSRARPTATATGSTTGRPPRRGG